MWWPSSVRAGRSSSSSPPSCCFAAGSAGCASPGLGRGQGASSPTPSCSLSSTASSSMRSPRGALLSAPGFFVSLLLSLAVFFAAWRAALAAKMASQYPWLWRRRAVFFWHPQDGAPGGPPRRSLMGLGAGAGPGRQRGLMRRKEADRGRKQALFPPFSALAAPPVRLLYSAPDWALPLGFALGSAPVLSRRFLLAFFAPRRGLGSSPQPTRGAFSP